MLIRAGVSLSLLALWRQIHELLLETFKTDRVTRFLLVNEQAEANRIPVPLQAKALTPTARFGQEEFSIVLATNGDIFRMTLALVA